MGCWGAGLYDDDLALEVKASVQLLARLPADGERLLAILRDVHAIEPGTADEIPFLLVVADQFERRGIPCPGVFGAAQAAIASDADIARLQTLGAAPGLLDKRRKLLAGLAGRLAAPRPPRAPRQATKPPPMVLETGEVFAFPTMNGFACSPWRLPTQGPFVGDGWGALVVLASGRAFDWFPWCALASTTVDPAQQPTLDDVSAARLIFHPQTCGAARCLPKPGDLRIMRLQRLGRLALDAERVAPLLSRWPLTKAIECGWSIAATGFAATVNGLPGGPSLSSLLPR